MPRDHGFRRDSDGELRYTYVASLRLSHPDADPRAWTDRIGLPPSLVERLGEPRIRGNKKKQYGVAKVSFWTHEFAVAASSVDFEDFLQSIASQLADRSEFLEELVKSGGDVELFIGFFLECSAPVFVLPASLQQKFAALHIDLVFNLYDWNREGEPESPNSQTSVAST